MLWGQKNCAWEEIDKKLNLKYPDFWEWIWMHFEVKNLILILFLKCPYVKTYASTKNILIFQKVCDKEGQEKVHKLQ
jgi:hypothetical protein